MTREFRRFVNIIGRNWHIYVCMNFQNLLAHIGGFGGQNWQRGGAMLTANELVLTSRSCYLAAAVGENEPPRNSTVRVRTD